MWGTEFLILDVASAPIKVQGRSLQGETLVEITVEHRWNELNKKQALELIEAIQNAIKEVD